MNIATLMIAATAATVVAVPAAAQSSYPYGYGQQTYPQQTYPQQVYPGTAYPGTSYPGTIYPGQAYPGQAYPQSDYNPYGSSGYGQYGQYGSGNSAVGQIINQLLGNRYAVNDRNAVTQCASAVMAQAQTQYRGYGQGGYGYQNGYDNQRYGNNYGSMMRVTAITDVQRKSGGLRVKGLIDSGRSGYGRYGQGGYNNQAYAGGDLSFRCNVDYRGSVTGIRIEPTTTYRRGY